MMSNNNRITGIACINIPVGNVSNSLDFYVNHLGCTLVREMKHFYPNITNAFIKFGDGPTALLHQEEVQYRLHFQRGEEAAPVLELLTDNITDLFLKLKKEKVNIVSEISESSCGHRFQVSDPDGNRITIIQS